MRRRSTPHSRMLTASRSASWSMYSKALALPLPMTSPAPRTMTLPKICQCGTVREGTMASNGLMVDFSLYDNHMLISV